ncbi:hypothetical protein [Streptomyces sp. NPDC058268]|uniref:hypothetical protein n=1 Tax=Streptomyces sp. NPDC058268 TaxID=3346413 RepID=UPI0036E8FA89
MSTDNARTRTRQLAVTIMNDLWPHTDLPRHPNLRPKRQHRPAARFRVPSVLSTSKVQIHDLVLIFDQRGKSRFDLLGSHTVREAVADRETVTARVIAKTDRTLTVVDCVVPAGYFWSSCYLPDFGTARTDAKPRTIRLNTTRRQIGHLGSLNDLRQRLHTHQDFADWQASHAAAVLEDQAEEAERRARWKAEEEQQRPQVQAAEQLNQIVGEDLVGWNPHPYGGLRINRWLAEPGRLRTYVAGLNATGIIPDDAYTKVETHLDLLGC